MKHLLISLMIVCLSSTGLLAQDAAPEPPAKDADTKAEPVDPMAWMAGTWQVSYFDANSSQIGGTASVYQDKSGTWEALVTLFRERENKPFYLISRKLAFDGKRVTMELVGQIPSESYLIDGRKELSGKVPTEEAMLPDLRGGTLSVAMPSEKYADTAELKVLQDPERIPMAPISLDLRVNEDQKEMAGHWRQSFYPPHGFKGQRRNKLDTEKQEMHGFESWKRLDGKITKVTTIDPTDFRIILQHPSGLYAKGVVHEEWLRIEGENLPEPNYDLVVRFEDDNLVYARQYRKDPEIEGAINILVGFKRELIPGPKNLTINDLPGVWDFEWKGLITKEIRYVRTPYVDVFDPATELYLGELFYVEVEYSHTPYFTKREGEVRTRGASPAKTPMTITPSPENPKIFRSGAFTLPGNPIASKGVATTKVFQGPSVASAVPIPEDAAEVAAKDGDTLLAFLTDELGPGDVPDPQGAANVLLTPDNEWLECLDIAKTCWYTGGNPLKEEASKGYVISNRILFELGHQRRIIISQRDHAALILGKRALTKKLRAFVNQPPAAAPIRETDPVKRAKIVAQRQAARLAFANLLVKAAEDGHPHPLLIFDVKLPDGSDARLGEALSDYTQQTYFKGKPEAFANFKVTAVMSAQSAMYGHAALSLQKLVETDDCDVENLLTRLGMGYSSILDEVKSKMIIPAGDGSGRMVPDRVAHASVAKIKTLYDAVKAQKKYSSMDKDYAIMLVLAASIGAGSFAAYLGSAGRAATAASYLTAFADAGMMVAELADLYIIQRDGNEWADASRQSDFAKGLAGVAGTEAYEEAEADRKSALLSLAIGGGAGVGGNLLGGALKRAAKNQKAIDDLVKKGLDEGVESLSKAERQLLKSAQQKAARNADAFKELTPTEKALLDNPALSNVDEAAEVVTVVDDTLAGTRTADDGVSPIGGGATDVDAGGVRPTETNTGGIAGGVEDTVPTPPKSGDPTPGPPKTDPTPPKSQPTSQPPKTDPTPTPPKTDPTPPKSQPTSQPPKSQPTSQPPKSQPTSQPPKSNPAPPKSQPTSQPPKSNPTPPKSQPTSQPPKSNPTPPKSQPTSQPPKSNPTPPKSQPTSQPPKSNPTPPKSQPTSQPPKSNPTPPKSQPVSQPPKSNPAPPKSQPVSQPPKSQPPVKGPQTAGTPSTAPAKQGKFTGDVATYEKNLAKQDKIREAAEKAIGDAESEAMELFRKQREQLETATKGVTDPDELERILKEHPIDEAVAGNLNNRVRISEAQEALDEQIEAARQAGIPEDQIEEVLNRSFTIMPKNSRVNAFHELERLMLEKQGKVFMSPANVSYFQAAEVRVLNGTATPDDFLYFQGIRDAYAQRGLNFEDYLTNRGIYDDADHFVPLTNADGARKIRDFLDNPPEKLLNDLSPEDLLSTRQGGNINQIKGNPPVDPDLVTTNRRPPSSRRTGPGDTGIIDPSELPNGGRGPGNTQVLNPSELPNSGRGPGNTQVLDPSELPGGRKAGDTLVLDPSELPGGRKAGDTVVLDPSEVPGGRKAGDTVVLDPSELPGGRKAGDTVVLDPSELPGGRKAGDTVVLDPSELPGGRKAGDTVALDPSELPGGRKAGDTVVLPPDELPTGRLPRDETGSVVRPGDETADLGRPSSSTGGNTSTGSRPDPAVGLADPSERIKRRVEGLRAAAEKELDDTARLVELTRKRGAELDDATIGVFNARWNRASSMEDLANQIENARLAGVPDSTIDEILDTAYRRLDRTPVSASQTAIESLERAAIDTTGRLVMPAEEALKLREVTTRVLAGNGSADDLTYLRKLRDEATRADESLLENLTRRGELTEGDGFQSIVDKEVAEKLENFLTKPENPVRTPPNWNPPADPDLLAVEFPPRPGGAKPGASDTIIEGGAKPGASDTIPEGGVGSDTVAEGATTAGGRQAGTEIVEVPPTLTKQPGELGVLEIEGTIPDANATSGFTGDPDIYRSNVERQSKLRTEIEEGRREFFDGVIDRVEQGRPLDLTQREQFIDRIQHGAIQESLDKQLEIARRFGIDEESIKGILDEAFDPARGLNRQTSRARAVEGLERELLERKGVAIMPGSSTRKFQEVSSRVLSGEGTIDDFIYLRNLREHYSGPGKNFGDVLTTRGTLDTDGFQPLMSREGSQQLDDFLNGSPANLPRQSRQPVAIQPGFEDSPFLQNLHSSLENLPPSLRPAAVNDMRTIEALTDPRRSGLSAAERGSIKESLEIVQRLRKLDPVVQATNPYALTKGTIVGARKPGLLPEDAVAEALLLAGRKVSADDLARAANISLLEAEGALRGARKRVLGNPDLLPAARTGADPATFDTVGEAAFFPGRSETDSTFSYLENWLMERFGIGNDLPVPAPGSDTIVEGVGPAARGPGWSDAANRALNEAPVSSGPMVNRAAPDVPPAGVEIPGPQPAPKVMGGESFQSARTGGVHPPRGMSTEQFEQTMEALASDPALRQADVIALHGGRTDFTSGLGVRSGDEALQVTPVGANLPSDPTKPFGKRLKELLTPTGKDLVHIIDVTGGMNSQLGEWLAGPANSQLTLAQEQAIIRELVDQGLTNQEVRDVALARGLLGVRKEAIMVVPRQGNWQERVLLLREAGYRNILVLK